MIYHLNNQYKDKIVYCVIMMMSNKNKNYTIVKTHTRWMTVKEYKRHSKQTTIPIHIDNNKHAIVTRSHVYFM